MKLIHLSDLHIGKRHNDEKFKRVLDCLNTHDDFSDTQHAVVITGDLIDDADDRHSLEQAKAMIDTLRPRFEGRIFLCPGNHDYGDFWGGHHRFIAQFRAIFGEYLSGSGSIPAAEYLPRELPYDSPFPVVDVLDDLVLIGLDTTADELDDGYSFGAEGRMGQRQLKALQSLLHLSVLQDKKVVLYFHHHPYHAVHYLNRFKDAEEFCQVLREACYKPDVLLFGHNHKYAICSSDSQQDGIPMALEGGKTTREMRFRVIDVNTLRFFEYRV